MAGAADQENAAGGEREGKGRFPGGGEEFGGLGGLGLADEESEAACGGDEAGGGWKGGGKAFHGAEGYDVGCRAGAGFGAAGEHIDVRQCKGAGELAEEGYLLVVRFDQGEMELGGPEFDGDSGEAGAGSDVDQGSTGRRSVREEVAGGEQRFSEVAGDDGFGLADGSEVDAGVPAE